MCQIKEKSVKAKSVSCYRIYEVFVFAAEVSFYNGQMRPPLKVKTECSLAPFHAFCSRKDVEKWKAAETLTNYPINIYLCKLSGKIKKGAWDHPETDIRTYTGTHLTIVKLVGTMKNRRLRWK